MRLRGHLPTLLREFRSPVAAAATIYASRHLTMPSKDEPLPKFNATVLLSLAVAYQFLFHGSALLEAQVVDSAGVEIVWAAPASDGPGAARRCVLGEEPSVVIGGPAGEEGALREVKSVVQLLDGRIAVANAGSGQIKVFGETGEHLYSVGELGDGPGDFRGLEILGVHGNRILAYDLTPSRITMLDFEGKLVDTMQVEFDSRLHEETGGWASGIEVPRGMRAVGWLGSGILVLKDTQRACRNCDGPVLDKSVKQKESTADLMLVGLDGSLVARLEGFPADDWAVLNEWSEISTPERPQRRRDSFSVTLGRAIKWGPTFQNVSKSVRTPYSKSFQAAVGRTLVAVGHTATAEVRFFDADGRLVRIFRRSTPPRRVGDAAREAWILEQSEGLDPPKRESRRAELASVEFPEFAPAFKSLALDGRERLWVEEFAGPGTGGAGRWTVYGGDGASFGSVATPPGFRPASFGTDHVLGVWKDERGVEYVQRYDLACTTPSAEGATVARYD